MQYELFFDTPIWRIVPDANAPWLVLELRNEALRNTSFTIVNLQTKRIQIPPFSLSEPWWVGIEQMYNGVLVLHGFDALQFAQHKGIYMCSAASGKELANIKEGVFRYISEGNLHYESLVGTTYEAPLPEGTLAVPAPNNVLLPGTLTEEDSGFSSIQAFVKAFCGQNAVKVAEYLEANGHIYISYYICENDLLDQHLLVIDSDGEKVFSEVLGTGLKGIGSGAFLVKGNCLVGVKNQMQLLMYEI